MSPTSLRSEAVYDSFYYDEDDISQILLAPGIYL